ncbi:BglG family transcription antiterminator [Oceanobacillus sp. J11TS1]|uniref:BglG family transcription antiterminator n=1 Tax=Oceanobacillus sp. J11TS1 TaxID=2807191 RepID=UPI001B1506B5|nr:PRD domain-containing protein [Oceanobacillus sp. J11TS1]GIO24823.1 transcriptional regulator MtlR [Oceanobacillus sp. J11TS1]
MYLTSRERHILGFLLSTEEEKTVKQIADKLSVSTRTIHRELKKLENVLATYHLTFHKKAGSGIRIQGDAQNKQQLKNKVAQLDGVELSEEERQSILLNTLIQIREPIKLFTLASELNVTIATISQDLDDMEERIHSFGLELIRKKGYGVEIQGDEGRKRAVLSNLISRHIDVFEFVEKIRGKNKEEKARNDTISDRLLRLVDPLKLEKIEKQVQEIGEELPYHLADSAYVGLVVHLALAIERLQKGDTIHFDEAYMREIQGTQAYQIAARLIKKLGDTFSIDIPEDEIGYITMHLMGAKLRENQSFLLEETSLDLAHRAKELIRKVAEQLHIDLSANNQLLSDLTTHLKPAIYRIKQQMNIHNPMLAEIKRDYLELFEVIEESMTTVFPDLKIPEEEIAYIVLHFAATILQSEQHRELRVLVICSTGIGTSKILASKLERKFPEIEIAKHQSIFDLNQAELLEYDVVVSTVHLENLGQSYVHISPMLTEEEAAKVKAALRKAALTRPRSSVQTNKMMEGDFLVNLQEMHRYSDVILQVLNRFRVYELETETGFLELICNQLQLNGTAEDKNVLLEKLTKREEQGGLGIPGSRLALFHTRSDTIKGPNFLIFQLPNKVALQGMDGTKMDVTRILMMLAPESAYKEALDILSYLSGLIIQDYRYLQLLQEATEKEIKQFMTKQFQLFIYEKFYQMENRPLVSGCLAE